MLPNGTSFQAALLELGQATPLLPLHDSAATSADVSYATSSISGPEEVSVPASTIGVAVASAVGAQVSEADEAAVRDKLEGLPSSQVYDNGGVAEGGWNEKLDVPAISRKDAQAIRDILLGNIKAPKHYSAGVGTGGFLSLAPEWQR